MYCKKYLDWKKNIILYYQMTNTGKYYSPKF